MTALFVSPKSNLSTSDELISAIGVDNTEILNGTVTTREVLQKIASTKPTEFYVAAHGDDKSTAMSDGILDPELVIQVMNMTHSIRTVFFNSCESIEQVSMIFRNVKSVRYGIGWAGDIGDEAAKTFAVTFFTVLGLSHDTVKAYDTGVRAIMKFHPNHRLPIMLNGRVARERLKVALAVASVGWGLSLVAMAVEFISMHR